MNIEDFLQVHTSPKCSTSNSRNHIYSQTFLLDVFFEEEIHANSCLFHTSKTATIYPPKLPYHKSAVLARQLSIVHGELRSNLLHLFTFDFFVGRHYPLGGHQNSRRWIWVYWPKKLPIDNHHSLAENY